MLCQFLQEKEVNQLYVCTYPPPLGPPSHLSSSSTQLGSLRYTQLPTCCLFYTGQCVYINATLLMSHPFLPPKPIYVYGNDSFLFFPTCFKSPMYCTFSFSSFPTFQQVNQMFFRFKRFTSYFQSYIGFLCLLTPVDLSYQYLFLPEPIRVL